VNPPSIILVTSTAIIEDIIKESTRARDLVWILDLTEWDSPYSIFEIPKKAHGKAKIEAKMRRIVTADIVKMDISFILEC
jgi:hypothetical protein